MKNFMPFAFAIIFVALFFFILSQKGGECKVSEHVVTTKCLPDSATLDSIHNHILEEPIIFNQSHYINSNGRPVFTKRSISKTQNEPEVYVGNESEEIKLTNAGISICDMCAYEKEVFEKVMITNGYSLFLPGSSTKYVWVYKNEKGEWEKSSPFSRRR